MQSSRVTCLTVLLCCGRLAFAVDHPPMITRELEHKQVYFMVGRTVKIHCEAEGTPKPRYRWTKNWAAVDVDSFGDRAVQEEGKGTLTFTSVMPDDAGIYQCLAENAYGIAASAYVVLIKAGIDYFHDTTEKTFRVNLGESLIMPCTPPVSFPPAKVSWELIDSSGQRRPVQTDSRVSMAREGNLVFANVLKSDEKIGYSYVCTVQNEVMLVELIGPKFSLYVEGSTPEPNPVRLMWATPQDMLAVKGQDLELQCIFGGYPTPSVAWMREKGKSLPERARIDQGKLLLTNLQISDGGTYICTGTSTENDTPLQRWTTVKVEAAPYKLEKMRPEVRGVGETAIFNCAAAGDPSPVFSWFINGVFLDDVRDPRIYNNSRVITDDRARLKIANLTLADSMVIQCNASNRHGYLWISAYLQVRENPLPPSIHTQPAESTILFKPGSTVHIPCVASGVPRPAYKWIRNADDFHIPETSTSIFQVALEGSLVFDNASEADEGYYQCLAVNSYGTSASDRILLRAAKLKVILPETNEVYYADKGSAVTMMCSPPAVSIPPAHIFWTIQVAYHVWVPIKQENRIIQDLEGQLHFTSTQKSDGRAYRCMAENVVLQENSLLQETLVAVQGDPKTTSPTELYTSPDQIVLKGSSLKLQCIFGGNPTPNITWVRKGSAMPILAIRKGFDTILEIPNIDYGDAGEYVCTGDNRVSPGPLEKSIAVQVQSKPSWVNKPTSKVIEGQNEATFICKARGKPEPKYEWFINGVPLDDMKSTVGGQIRVNSETSVTFSGLGDVSLQCNASNIHGYLWADFYLDVPTGYQSSSRAPPTSTGAPAILSAVLPMLLLFSGILFREHLMMGRM